MNPQTPKGPRFLGQVQPDWITLKAGDLQEFVNHLRHKNYLCDEVNIELGFPQEQCCLSPVLHRSVLVLMSQDPLCTSGCFVSLTGALAEFDVSPRVIPVIPDLPPPTGSPCSQAQRGAMMLNSSNNGKHQSYQFHFNNSNICIILYQMFSCLLVPLAVNLWKNKWERKELQLL